MPFGHDCEFLDFDACVAAISKSDSVNDPDAVSAALMKETEPG